MPGKLVSRMSNRKCFTISDVDTIKFASQKFHENQIGCLPVLDKDKKVVGILIPSFFNSLYCKLFEISKLRAREPFTTFLL